MKHLVLVPVAIIFLTALAAVPHATTFAAADATCVSDPTAGPVGTTFVITCSGYTPNSYVYAYLVEPSGAAGELFDQSGAIKVKEDGSISYTQPSKYGNTSSLMTGTWSFVAEELGLANTVLHRGETKFTVTGGTEGVSGAVLSADPSTLHKPEVAYDHIDFGPGTINFLASSEPATISGAGFQPGEVVTFWVEPAGGGCSSMTAHQSIEAGVVQPSVAALFVREDLSYPIYDGLGSQLFANVTADADGAAAVNVYVTSAACEGAWRFVARGNTSLNGGETWLTVIGNAVATNAWLTADPGTVTAMFDTVQFSGYGFGANEHISCWLTTPQGQTLGYPHEYIITYSLPGEFIRNQQIRSDAGGNIAFSLMTGSVYEHVDMTLSAGGVSQNFTGTFLTPRASEGALGEYAMSCRGDVSGNAAITRFTVTGGFVDP
ncbi:MAG: hypothetical protein HY741_23475 [Chloroflexi bacterium]|nr:hypothetical protein [Chloroflexota bacterium]